MIVYGDLAAVVLAAGRGTRLYSSQPKVLHPVLGQSMLKWVLDGLAWATPSQQTLVVTGHQADLVEAQLPDGIDSCRQEPLLGSGHALEVALPHLDREIERILVVPGDTPLLNPELISHFHRHNWRSDAAATVLTNFPEDPTGYGRIVRDSDGEVQGIVEQTDTTPEQQEIEEVNSGIYLLARAAAEELLPQLPFHSNGEKYLTDLIGLLHQQNQPVVGFPTKSPELVGVNNLLQLAEANQHAQETIVSKWMTCGVEISDPRQTYIEPGVRLAPGCRLHPGVFLRGDTEVTGPSELGPYADINQSIIGSDVRISYSVLNGVEVGDGVTVGPFASLRPGTVLAPKAKIGTFVETKQTKVGEEAKIPHLSYIGDAEVGEKANVGAGSITCNYDGIQKHRTVIGADSFIGSDTMLVAPVEIGARAWTGAGSVINRDVPPGALAIERNHQRHIEGYDARRRPSLPPGSEEAVDGPEITADE